MLVGQKIILSRKGGLCDALQLEAALCCTSRSANFYIYIRRLDDINVQACACDSLYRTITKFSFSQFYGHSLYTTVKLSAVLSI